MAHLELYERLGFDNNEVTFEEIKNRYRKLVMDCHPDRHPDDETKAQAFKYITEAYEVLIDKNKRKKYDTDGDIKRDNEEEQINQFAINFLTTVWLDMIAQIPEQAMDTNDIRELVFQNINQNRRTKNNELNIVNMHLRKYQKSLDKMKRRSQDKSDIIQIAVKERVDVLKSQLKVIQFMFKTLDRMKEILNDYDYDFTKPPSEYSIWNTTIPSGSGAMRLVFRSG